jgi:pimeloyl-ACP methyl ester carboxylesterase
VVSVLRSFAGGRLFGAVTGDETPRILALPGWARTHRDFEGVLAGLPAVALDLPGFGASPPPPEPWTTSRYAEAIRPVLDDLAPSVVVLGHSFGGRVALHLGAERPARLGALVLSGVPLVPPEPRRRPPVRYRVVRTLHRWHAVGDGRMEAARQRYGSADYRAATGVMRDVLVRTVGERYDAQLAALRCPVTFVWGDDDSAAPLAPSQAAAADVNGEWVICPGAGHLTPLTAPEELRAALLRHLGGRP